MHIKIRVKIYNCDGRTGYVGLSIATILGQYHKVFNLDIILEKVKMINQKSPIQDEYIEKYPIEKS